MQQSQKWTDFLKELGNLVFFWIVGILFFTVYRVVFIALFRQQIGKDVGISEYLKALYMGFRFDATAISYFLALPFLSLLIFSYLGKFDLIKKIRKICQYAFAILSTLVCIITYNYFREYNGQFNNFLFLGMYDDQYALATTIVKYFNPVLNGFVIIATIFALIYVFRRYESKTTIANLLNKNSGKAGQIIVVFLSLLLFVGSIRGSFTKVPAIRKWSAVTKDGFLNKTIINPYRSFTYALADFNDLNYGGKNPFLKGSLEDIYNGKMVTDIIQKEAAGNTIPKPKQIFLIIMESYDSWPLMDKYSSFGLANNLKKIAEEGTHYTNFLPAGSATFYSFGAIVTGTPYCGVNISQIGTLNDPYEGSIFKQFKKLGYETNVFYGGFLSWENIGDFVEYQGADRIYSGVDMGGKSESGEWGVEDEKLFDMVLSKIDPNKYTLNVILTSSYHAPYVVDIYKKGFPFKNTDQFPADVKKYYEGEMTLQEMGHLWYGDKAIGDFMDQAKKKYGNGLFAFTGDHFGRRFINGYPNLYEKSAVPFVLYGKNVPKAKSKTPGSHIDIIPTLIEMVAPKGFKYYSFGTDMRDTLKPYGIGLHKTIDRNAVDYFEKDVPAEALDLNGFREINPVQLRHKTSHDNLMALAWHYTMRGNSLKDSVSIEEKSRK